MMFICMFSLTNYSISKLDLYSILLMLPVLVKHRHVRCEKHCLFFGGRTEAAGSEKMEQFGDRMKSVWVAKTAL